MDQRLQDFIDDELSVDALTKKYISIAFDIEKEIHEQDQAILGRTVHVSAFVNHTDSGAQSTGDINSGLYADRYNILTHRNDLVSADEAAVDSALSQVKSLSDVIVFSFQISHDVVNFIWDALAKHSPFKSGRYMHSHVIFADGVLVENVGSVDFSNRSFDDTSSLPEAKEYLFVNTLPYSRKIEKGESSMAPSGVYELVAEEARAAYGFNYKIDFIDYTGTFGVMAEATKATYGKRTKTHMNRADNRFPAIRVIVTD